MSVQATCWAVLGQHRGGWGAPGIMVRAAGSLSSVDSAVLQLSGQGWRRGAGSVGIAGALRETGSVPKPFVLKEVIRQRGAGRQLSLIHI